MRPAVALLTVAALGCGQPSSPRLGFATQGIIAWSPQRAPAVPLVVRDPYLNVWATSDHPADDWPHSFISAVGNTLPAAPPHTLAGLAIIDGTPYRFLGPAPQAIAELPLVAVTIRPSRTRYDFAAGGVALAVDFTTPLLPGDATAMALPGAWIDLTATATDGATHDVALYLDVGGDWARGDTSAPIQWSLARVPSQMGEVLRWSALAEPGTESVYNAGGDTMLGNDRFHEWPDWGELSFATRNGATVSFAAGVGDTLRAAFLSSSALGNSVDPAFGPWGSHPVSFAFADHLAAVDASGQTRGFFVGHGRAKAISFQTEDCMASWTRLGDLSTVTALALDGEATWRAAIDAHDDALLAEATAAGNADYAALIALAHRQAFAGTEGCTVTHDDGTSDDFVFMKELVSGSFIQTVDVLYPAAPAWLHEDPASLGRMLEPHLQITERYGFGTAFAAHDLGRYPIAENMTYAKDAPVECTADLLILVDAYVQATGDVAFAERHEATLAGWADYLVSVGDDPPLQWSTDDFQSQTADSANLGIKSVVGIAAWAQLCDAIGRSDGANYRSSAELLAADWVARALDAQHTTYTLDLATAPASGGSWSLKYNLLADRLLGTQLVSQSVVDVDVAWYLAQAGPYGTPLDSAFTQSTKADWLSWVASIASRDEDFAALMHPIARMLEDTPDRVPFTDLYNVTTMQRPFGFSDRPVVGALYARMLLKRPPVMQPLDGNDGLAAPVASCAVARGRAAGSTGTLVAALGVLLALSWRRRRRAGSPSRAATTAR